MSSFNNFVEFLRTVNERSEQPLRISVQIAMNVINKLTTPEQFDQRFKRRVALQSDIHRTHTLRSAEKCFLLLSVTLRAN